LGEIIDRQGSLRTVSGVPGSFLRDAERANGVLASACSRTLCVAKLKDSVLAGDALVSAPPGSALIAINGSEAVLYFSAEQQFARL
jgi:hypothetical protein